jgi:PHP family Zn ribbon phosphoesterase
VFGTQVIANELDEVEGFQQKMLIGATDIPVEQVLNRIHQLNGLGIASHIDRESFSVISQLGFIPDSLRFDALEISSNITEREASTRFSEYKHHSFIRNSDAHLLNQIGNQTTTFLLEEPTLHELARGLRGEGGRAIQSRNLTTENEGHR